MNFGQRGRACQSQLSTIFDVDVSAIPICLIRVHVGVDKRCRAIHSNSSTVISSGVVMDIAAFKVSHSVGPDSDATAIARSSGVVMDIAAVKVSHSVGPDIDTTALSGPACITFMEVVMDFAAYKVSHSVKVDNDATAEHKNRVVMDIAAFKVSHSVGADTNTTTPPSCLIRVHVGVGQCCRALDVESPAVAIMSRKSGVVMDIAAFKVSHSIGEDIDASARPVSIRICLIRVHVGVGQCCRALDVESPAQICLIRVHVGIGQCCRAGDVESPALQAKNRARDVPSGRWRKCLGKRFKRQTLCTRVAYPPVMLNPISSAVPPDCISKTLRPPLASSTTLPGTCASMVRARLMQTADP